LRFMKKALKRHGSPETITHWWSSLSRANNVGAWLRGKAGGRPLDRNGAVNSHLPLRRRERAILRFRRIKGLQKFASVHPCSTTQFAQKPHLLDRQTYKIRRSVAPPEWRPLMA
jgi:putative transposase